MTIPKLVVEQDKISAVSKAGGRGPSYPAISIEAAIAKAQQFWNAERRNAAPIASAAKHWGYSETSSSGKVVVAALLHYGLMEDAGSKEGRTVKLSPRGLDIVLDAPDSPKRAKAVRDAVMAPKLYADLLAKWPASELPSDQTLRYYLLREKSFNEGTVSAFIKDLRSSIAYAKLDNPGEKPVLSQPLDVSKTDAASGPTVQVGDFVQWEANGALKMAAPRRVRAIQEDPVEGWWVFVDGSESGIPMEETVMVEKGQVPASGIAKSAPVLSLPAEPLQENEQEWRGALSKAASYRLIVKGQLGPKEIGKLIMLLEAQKAVLSDDDEETKH